jgi:rfaE bifunctional protein kinase chain/domain
MLGAMTSSSVAHVPEFTEVKVAVIGDLIADHNLYGRPERFSREAPVMVLRQEGEDYTAGGAGNVARNIYALGAATRLFGAVGGGEVGQQLRASLEAERIDVSGVLTVDGWRTPTKTRVMAAEARRTPQQLLRIDREPEQGPSEEAIAELAGSVRAAAGEIDALLVSDYQYGMVGTPLFDAVGHCLEQGVTVVLDPRKNLHLFRGLTAVTPNLAELARAVGRPEEDMEDAEIVVQSAHSVLSRDEPRWLLVTMGNRGMALFGDGLPDRGLAVAASGSQRIIDVSGAGDTAAATFTLALAAGLEGPEAMRLANAAAGEVVMESGIAVCSSSRLRAALPRSPAPREFDEVMRG